jgi:hypothetical protein
MQAKGSEYDLWGRRSGPKKSWYLSKPKTVEKIDDIIELNPDCIYNKIHNKIKSTFNIYFRKQALKYALET